VLTATFCVRVALLEAYPGSGGVGVEGLYTALIWCIPPVSELVVKEAWPSPLRGRLLPFGGTTPSMVNVTVPVGIGSPVTFGETVAVKVTDWPGADGLTDETSVVRLARRTSWGTVGLPAAW